MISKDPWSLEALGERLSESYGVGADADLPDGLRFIRGVAELARARHARGETVADLPVVFVLHPQPEATQIGSRPANPPTPMLDDADEAISGRIWFVNHVVNDGISVDLLPSDNKRTIFSYVEDEVGLGHAPTAVISLRPDEFLIRFYPEGLNSPSSATRQDLTVATLSRDEVLQVMDGLWENELSTPLAQGYAASTWRDPANLVPASNPELVVQRVIKAGLTGRYLGVFKVHQEQTGAGGRFDLLIEQPNPLDRSQVTKHVLIELKVLRDKYGSGAACPGHENDKAIKKGITQAARYRDEWDVRSSVLCCFDMRGEVRGAKAFEGHEERAMKRSVELWIRHLFPTAEAYRDYLESAIA